MYGPHPSPELRDCFERKPYQGADPASAFILFLGLDANYSAEISETPFFERILEYHRDGVAFWQQYGVHHPFLLPEYPLNRTRGGVPYHRNFAKLGLSATYADQISFVELLDIPTIGNTTQGAPEAFFELINVDYLKALDAQLMANRPKHIFTYRAVVQRLQKLRARYGVFTWLDCTVLTDDEIPVLYDDGQTRLYQIYSFSASHIHRQLPTLQQLLLTRLAPTPLIDGPPSQSTVTTTRTVSPQGDITVTITTETTETEIIEDQLAEMSDTAAQAEPLPDDHEAGQRVIKEWVVLACLLGLLSQSWWVLGLCLLMPVLMLLNRVVAGSVLLLRVIAWGAVGVQLGQWFGSPGISVGLGLLCTVTAGLTSLSAIGYFRD